MANLVIQTNPEETKLTLSLSGRLDTNTSPLLEEELKLDDVTELVMDFENLEYVSSAGLRVILNAQKTMNRQGSMKLINVCEEIMEVFEMTGFDSILTIE